MARADRPRTSRPGGPAQRRHEAARRAGRPEGTEPEPDHRGRDATRPRDLTRRDWRDILLRVKNEIGRDNLDIIAAGVAFYGLLAIFPALAALISIYGLVADPGTIAGHLEAAAAILPEQAAGILRQQLAALTAAPRAGLGLGALFGLLLTLWSATKGVKALMTALNIAYEEEEKRGFLRLNLVALALTLGAMLFALVGLAAIVVLPAVLGLLVPSALWQCLVSLARWPVLALLLMIGLAILYRYGPSRATAQWRWVTWGAVLVTVLWLAGSVLFSWYVASFGSYNETYGSVGAVVILLLWFYYSAFLVLIGAELDAEMEHQTAADTTTGSTRPMGERGAYVADHVAPSP